MPIAMANPIEARKKRKYAQRVLLFRASRSSAFSLVFCFSVRTPFLLALKSLASNLKYSINFCSSISASPLDYFYLSQDNSQWYISVTSSIINSENTFAKSLLFYASRSTMETKEFDNFVLPIHGGISKKRNLENSN
jgi:hypothetical protein